MLKSAPFFGLRPFPISAIMLQDLLLVLNMLICLALIGVVLMQRSEGGAFGTGGPTGLVTARGAGDLLTRTTWILFTLFLVLSLTLTLLGGRERSSEAILQRLKNTSVNPDQLIRPAPATQTPTGASPAPIGPTQAPPPAITLPPVAGSAPVPSPSAHRLAAAHKTSRSAAPSTAPVPAAPSLNLGTPQALSLPPITASPDAPSSSPSSPSPPRSTAPSPQTPSP